MFLSVNDQQIVCCSRYFCTYQHIDRCVFLCSKSGVIFEVFISYKTINTEKVQTYYPVIKNSFQGKQTQILHPKSTLFKEIPDLPRMSKKKKEEYALFLNKKSRIAYNPVCLRCQKDCKQSFRAVLLACNKYQKKER